MRARSSLLALAIVGAMLPFNLAHAGAPYGLHVAYGADPRTSATIAWFTTTLTDPGSIVEYGPTDALGASISGTSQKVQGLSNLVHEALLTGLTPGAEVFYRVGGSTGFSPIHSFSTAPAGSDFRMTIFGDHGVKPQAASTVAQVAATKPNFQLIPGDISYAQPGDGSFPNLQKWEQWFQMMEPFASETPVMVAAGNHESEVVGGSGSFRTRFAMPGAELYYSFDVGRVHFLVLASDYTGLANERIAPAQLAFAQTDLAAASLRKARGELDFIVVTQHHPLYSTMYSNPPDSLLGRQINPTQVALLEPMLVRYDVDLLVAAHNHQFERSSRMIARQVTGDASDGAAPGYVQLATGGGGESLYAFDANGAPWSVARASRFHYTEVSAARGKLSVRVISTDENPGQILDQFTLNAG